METIFALSSAYGKAGVGIIRISGNKSLDVVKLLCKNATFKPRVANYVTLKNPIDNSIIDKSLLIYFKAPNSFTGEDLVEIHVHGSIAVYKKLFEVLVEYCRPAEAGEFSKRAFLNGKIDLTAAEAIADLINAETDLQAKQAIRQMTGELKSLYEGWYKKLLRSLAFIEAFIDFPEENIPEAAMDEIHVAVNELITTIEAHLNDQNRGERLRSGLYLSIFGPPNAGKSSLMNYLVKREISIVSSIAGTTRDLIEAPLDIAGYPIILADTAGIREGGDEIENEGIKRAEAAVKNSDIKIFMFDASNYTEASKLNKLIDEDTIIVANKIDLSKNLRQFGEAIEISVTNKINMEAVLKAIELKAEKIIMPNMPSAITQARYRKNLNLALQALKSLDFKNELVLSAEHIRLASRHLSFLTGIIGTEEILGEIFSNFCIGK